MLRFGRFIQCPPEHDAALWIQYLSRLGAAKLHERTKMNLPSIGLRLFHDSSFGSGCLQISGVLPSSLVCPSCEASQAAGTIKTMGIAIEMWAKLNQSAKVGPSQQHSAVLPLEVSTFGSARLRQLFEFLPSGLLLSFCEASQAVGIHRVLGIGTRAWAGLDHSTTDPF